MFSLKHVVNGITMPLTILYVDSLNTTYQFENIIVEAQNANDSLDLYGGNSVCSFEGDLFPLSGSAYLVAETGTLSISITQAFDIGWHKCYFGDNGFSVLPPMGVAPCGTVPFGVHADYMQKLPVIVRVQHYPIPGIIQEAPGNTAVRQVP